MPLHQSLPQLIPLNGRRIIKLKNLMKDEPLIEGEVLIVVNTLGAVSRYPTCANAIVEWPENDVKLGSLLQVELWMFKQSAKKPTKNHLHK